MAQPDDRTALQQRNTQLVRDYYAAVARGDADAVAALWADDAIMDTVFSRPPMSPRVAPPHMAGADVIRPFWRAFMATVRRNDITLELFDALAADPAWVVARVRTDMELGDGTPYRNQYHNLLRLRGGQIVEYYEYSNPLAILEAFGGDTAPRAAPTVAAR